MLEKVLIANRGEIACRVISTCRRLGVATVAIYSDADSGARHVRLADEAVHIGSSPATQSYLDIDAVVAAARATGATAVHPGYGFLAENAAFARACAAAGITFIGPSADTIAVMGSKAEAKRLMEQAGVPTIPGYHGDDQSDATLVAAAKDIGLPLLVKASAGGGGKGMRIVRKTADLEAALAAARREARSAFGDDHLILERFLERPRHIEYQVFGDNHGNVVHLFERECSIQRRYQKIIEESPSPFLTDELRSQMGAAAVAAASAVDYSNAGTIEFIVSAEREFFFLEMNTRLQVEHPVTEATTGLDLVEWQLRIAAGEPLPLQQEQISQTGHAIEARIYAENPAQDFMPSTGTIDRFSAPADEPGVRLDTGYDSGDEVTIHYDPMLAKLICFADDRGAALARLRQALARTAVFGPQTNLALLREIAHDPVFAAGEADTSYIDRHLDDLLAPQTPPQRVYFAAACGQMLGRESDWSTEWSPWDIADGWQANGMSSNLLALSAPGADTQRLRISGRRGDYTITDESGNRSPVQASISEFGHFNPDGTPASILLDSDDDNTVAGLLRNDATLQVVMGDRAWTLHFDDPYPGAEATTDDATHPGSPMPGRIVALHVSAGDRVEEGQPLVVLEGMKMEVTVAARVAGIVQRVLYAEGDNVEAEVPLIDIEPAATN
ncbi:MAG: acetyl-CoA carboxylase biotin carboxylase subunit [Gammaproteobacteria bacterium]|nr:acetyl-CoA carboxylase biotin carboxylase subunit [Gammaproteobacteria bacterium]NND60339.1 acetyl-CoA carboxylase biotin carboxylase subunit [Gammaproteobacteria bacterium]